MPNRNSIVARVTDATTIEQAREQGFTTFTFYPTLLAARDASTAVELANMPHIKTVAFTEVFEIEGTKIRLHVLAQTRRPKPRVTTLPTKRSRFDAPHHGGMCPDCGWFICQCPPQTAVEILERLAGDRRDEGARLLMHASWHLENPLPQHNAKLDAFAIFMGEWAAKIRNAVR